MIPLLRRTQPIGGKVIARKSNASACSPPGDEAAQTLRIMHLFSLLSPVIDLFCYVTTAVQILRHVKPLNT